MLDKIELNPKQPAEACIIFLHGLGADGHDFENLPRMLQLPQQATTKFIFPHAPMIPVTLNGGMHMHAWFDIYGLRADSPQDQKGIEKAASLLNQIIDAEIANGIDSRKIILGGFSQGGALALYTGLHHPHKLAGILGLSTFLVLADIATYSSNQQTPILLAHGQQDPMVPIQLGELMRDYLLEQQHPVSWHSYPMQHQICPQEIEDVSQWLQVQLTQSH